MSAGNKCHPELWSFIFQVKKCHVGLGDEAELWRGGRGPLPGLAESRLYPETCGGPRPRPTRLCPDCAPGLAGSASLLSLDDGAGAPGGPGRAWPVRTPSTAWRTPVTVPERLPRQVFGTRAPAELGPSPGAAALSWTTRDERPALSAPRFRHLGQVNGVSAPHADDEVGPREPPGQARGACLGHGRPPEPRQLCRGLGSGEARGQWTVLRCPGCDSDRQTQWQHGGSWCPGDTAPRDAAPSPSSPVRTSPGSFSET